MPPVVYIDGEFVPLDQARVSVLDHGLLYGDGIFEGIRVYNGRIFRLTQHLERLYASARGIELAVPMDIDELASAVLRTVAVSGLSDAYIRLVVTRGIGDLGLDPRRCGAPSVFIIVSTIQLYPPEVYRAGLRLISCRTLRTPASSLNPSVKSLNYLNNILAKLEVAHAGADEGIMLNQAGYVAECTADNIFIVRAGEVVTPSPEAGILIGVTRNAVIEVTRAVGYVLREELFKLGDVMAADECFLTGTGAEIAPVRSVDGCLIGTGEPGAVTNRLHGAFQELTAREGTPIEAGVR